MNATVRLMAPVVIVCALLAVGISLAKQEYNTAIWAGNAAVWAAMAIFYSKEPKR